VDRLKCAALELTLRRHGTLPGVQSRTFSTVSQP
jgi:hypothetical protein